MFGVETLLLVALIIFILYKWSTKTFKTFEERGIPFEKPLPILGNTLALFKNKQNLHKTLYELYGKAKKHKVYGHYNFRDPVFLILDPEIIKKVTVKDFDVFANHQRLGVIDADPLLSGMLTVMKDQRWKNMRNTLTPAFTGAKMRAMFTLMNDCFEEAISYLHKQEEPGKKTFEIELKDCFTRLSNDLIATTAFGLKTNSFAKKNNEFYEIGKKITNTRGLTGVKFALLGLFPNLFKLLNIRLLDVEKTNYFVDLVIEAMKYREANNIVRPDMIQLLLEAKRESAQQYTEMEIVAQCLIFFFAAFENNATLLGTTCYELADNQDIQQRLYEEIIETYEQLNGKTLDYDTIQNMKYMDMVIHESLRKWTLAPQLDRECSKDYKLYDDDGNMICQFKEGDKLWFLVIGLQRDEQYFEHPDVFDPERFSDENKHKIKPFTYMPFGVGPRNCIGNRYALMQAKAMLFFLLKDYKVERNEKLSKNLLDDAVGFSLTPSTGFWFNLTKRVPTTNL